MLNMNVHVGARIPEDLAQAFELAVAVEHRSKSDALRDALEAYVSTVADRTDDERPRAGGQARASSLPGRVEAERAPG